MKNFLLSLENIWMAVAFAEVGEFESSVEMVTMQSDEFAEVKLTA